MCVWNYVGKKNQVIRLKWYFYDLVYGVKKMCLMSYKDLFCLIR